MAKRLTLTREADGRVKIVAYQAGRPVGHAWAEQHEVRAKVAPALAQRFHFGRDAETQRIVAEIETGTVPEGFELWYRVVPRRRDEWRVESCDPGKYGTQVVETLGYEFCVRSVRLTSDAISLLFRKGWGRATCTTE